MTFLVRPSFYRLEPQMYRIVLKCRPCLALTDSGECQSAEDEGIEQDSGEVEESAAMANVNVETTSNASSTSSSSAAVAAAAAAAAATMTSLSHVMDVSCSFALFLFVFHCTIL